MPLPPPNTKRKHVHTRTIICKGFERTDGAWEVEGWITDVKTYGVDSSERIHVPAGEPMHGMGMRLTVDDNMQVSDVVAVQDYSPYRICQTITPNFRKLIGLSLAKGFRKSVRKMLGGTNGCVHLVDILGPMATTIFQSQTKKRSKQFEKARSLGEQLKPPVLNTCHAWSSTSSVVRKSFPDFYTGK